MLSTMRELVNQIQDLSEDKELPDAVAHIDELCNEWDNLAKRLTVKRECLSVRIAQTYLCLAHPSHSGHLQ
jgi:hypothetical protein